MKWSGVGYAHPRSPVRRARQRVLAGAAREPPGSAGGRPCSPHVTTRTPGRRLCRGAQPCRRAQSCRGDQSCRGAQACRGAQSCREAWRGSARPRQADRRGARSPRPSTLSSARSRRRRRPRGRCAPAGQIPGRCVQGSWQAPKGKRPVRPRGGHRRTCLALAWPAQAHLSRPRPPQCEPENQTLHSTGAGEAEGGKWGAGELQRWCRGGAAVVQGRCRSGAEAVQGRCRGGAEAVQRRCRGGAKATGVTLQCRR